MTCKILSAEDFRKIAEFTENDSINDFEYIRELDSIILGVGERDTGYFSVWSLDSG
jgi:hypothetical protein